MSREKALFSQILNCQILTNTKLSNTKLSMLLSVFIDHQEVLIIDRDILNGRYLIDFYNICGI